jgi:pilus assembly protein Flp/PilA
LVAFLFASKRLILDERKEITVTTPLIAPIQTSPNLNPVELRTGYVNLWNDESGQDLVEYALLGALIALTAATSVRGLSTKISGAFTSVSSALTSDV